MLVHPLMQIRWDRVWERLRLPGDRNAWLYEIIARYTQPHRHYHTIEHLHHGIELFQFVVDELEHPEEVLLVWFFHDAVYDPHRRDNEEQSANWMATLYDHPRTRAMLMATRHHEISEDHDTRRLVDLDLGVFGRTPERFDLYEEQIMREYAFVPVEQRLRIRREILKRFNARTPIYTSKYMYSLFEAKAHANLSRAIDRLNILIGDA